MSDIFPGSTVPGGGPLVITPPSTTNAFDDSQKRWATFLEFLKIDVALAGALLGAFALVFSDTSKVPPGPAKWMLAGVTITTLLSLVFSLVAIIWINRLVIDRAEAIETKANQTVFTKLEKEAGNVSLVTLCGFLFLSISGILIAAFILIRALAPPPTIAPTLPEEIRGLRQSVDLNVRTLQGSIAEAARDIGSRIDQAATTQAKNQEDVLRFANGLAGALQARIAELEKRAAELERSLQQLGPKETPPAAGEQRGDQR